MVTLIMTPLYGNLRQSWAVWPDLMDFGQIFEAFGNNYIAYISYILRQLL